MKKLGFGCMRLPLKNKKIGGSVDLERTKEMVDYYMADGFTYFDTAYMYHDGRSERSMRETLVKRHNPKRFGKSAVGGGILLYPKVESASNETERFAYFVAQDKVRGSAP